jgi:nucleoside-diphosphate-sugar epimerase
MTSGSVLVTGASGFIGEHLATRLISGGYYVGTHSRKDGDLSHCALDYRGVQHVFHLAGKSFVPDSWLDPRSFYEANLLATVNVLEFCRCTGASMTYVSSYVYGRPQRIPVGEDHPLEAFNPYSHTKILAEETCRFYSAHYGVRIAIVRPFNVYGPGQDGRFLIPVLVRQALDPACPVIEVADDRPRRDFLYVSDLVELLVATLGRDASGTYNAGSGVSVGIGEVVGILNRLIPRPKQLVSRGESRLQDIAELAADIGKAARELQWRPTVDMTSGLRLTVEHESSAQARSGQMI